METIKLFFTDFDFTSAMGIILYWMPATICSVGYFLRTLKNYRHDIVSREEASRNDNLNYRPTDTIGTLIGRGLVSTIPVCNLFAAVFDVAPSMLGRFFGFIGRVFDQPLVPRVRNK